MFSIGVTAIDVAVIGDGTAKTELLLALSIFLSDISAWYSFPHRLFIVKDLLRASRTSYRSFLYDTMSTAHAKYATIL